MKSTKVQTLGAVALHAATACTGDASSIGLSPLNCGQESSVLPCLTCCRVCAHRVCTHFSHIHACVYAGPLLH